jgi:glycosyl hydrolase family 32
MIQEYRPLCGSLERLYLVMSNLKINVMSRLLISIFMLLSVHVLHAQFSVQYDADKQPSNKMQYFKPAGNLFVGDCIPFFHNDTYYLYWLLDSAHHSALKGLGGHQWALSTSRDLVNWKHYPVVLGIDEDWEKSICTGSVVYKDNLFYAFYATRLLDANGAVNEQLSYAISKDGIHFEKQKPNPFYTSAPGYSKRNFRDPKVSVDLQGKFHLFVSSATDSAMTSANGAMVHLVSGDLKKWDVMAPLIANQDDVPECPDYFEWNGWYYLVYGRGGNTFYLQSRNKYGPWQYPSSQALDEDWNNVVKTAAFTNGRRIAAGWIPSRREGHDDGGEVFGGNVLIREIIQAKDGSLLTRFAKELIPATGGPLSLTFETDSLTTKIAGNSYRVKSPGGRGAFRIATVPVNARITFEANVESTIEDFGVILRGNDKSNEKTGYMVRFMPENQTVSLHNTSIKAVDGLSKKVKVDIVMQDDIIDVNIGGRRCIANRLAEQKGGSLVFFAKHGTVTFQSIVIAPIK